MGVKTGEKKKLHVRVDAIGNSWVRVANRRRKPLHALSVCLCSDVYAF
jgi:hypothetical protein